MGRWAQRRRTGGGPAALTPSTLGQLVLAERDADTVSVHAVWSAPVTDTDFVGSDFETLPGNITIATITQDGANGLLLEFVAPVTLEATLSYTGSAPGIITPDSIALTNP